MNTKPTIAVIGCGVIGITTGILLLRKGMKVHIYTNALPHHTASTIACAIWLPFGTSKHYSHDYYDLLRQWCIDSLLEFRKLVGNEYGVKSIRNHELFRKESDVPEFLWLLSDILPNFEAEVDDSLPEGFLFRVSFDTFVIETGPYLQKLLTDFIEAGGQVIEKTFEDYGDIFQLKESVIFNCLGLGAKQIFSDQDLKPVKGQLLFHKPIELNIALGCDEYCLVPRSDALIFGALWQEEFTSIEPTQENSDMIWSKVCELLGRSESTVAVPSHLIQRESIFNTVAALRPFRANGVRIERESVENKIIIHNYGHGGGGISLSWGTASKAISLVDDLFSD